MVLQRRLSGSPFSLRNAFPLDFIGQRLLRVHDVSQICSSAAWQLKRPLKHHCKVSAPYLGITTVPKQAECESVGVSVRLNVQRNVCAEHLLRLLVSGAKATVPRFMLVSSFIPLHPVRLRSATDACAPAALTFVPFPF